MCIYIYTCLQTYFDTLIGIFIDIFSHQKSAPSDLFGPQWLPVHISWVRVRVSIVAERAREGPLGGAMACDKKLLRRSIRHSGNAGLGRKQSYGKSQGFCGFQVQAMVSGFLCSQLQ